MRKTATFVTLALAAVFAVAVGEDEIRMSSSTSANYFERSSASNFAKSVTLTVDGQPIVKRQHKVVLFSNKFMLI